MPVTEPCQTGVPDAQTAAELGALALLGTLRDDKAQRLDPARFHFLELMARRMLGASGLSRSILAGKLANALAAYDARFRQVRQAAGHMVAHAAAKDPALAREMRRLVADGEFRELHLLGAKWATAAPSAALAELNAYIRTASQAISESGVEGVADAKSDMKSVRRFRETWSRISSQHQLEQAVGRGPENAGPLNSHSLMLQSLAMMHRLSPDYLQRFLSHAGSLLWLEQVNHKHKVADKDAANKPKVARVGRQKK